MRNSVHGKGHEEGGSGVPLEILEHLPQNQSLPTFCFVLSPTPLTLRGAVPHHHLSPEQVLLATCDCSEPPNCERHEMF